MKIVATSLGHDGSACFLEDGHVRYWNKQERLSRIKRQAIPFLPLLEIERHFDLSDVNIYVSTSPQQELQDGQISEAAYYNWYASGNPFYNYFRSVHPKCKIRSLVSHHLGHAACAFYGSGFDSAYVLVVDRNGSVYIDETNRTAVGTETETLFYCRYPCYFEVVYRNPPIWVGITGIYCLASEKIGLGEMENGKTMGLAAYGKDRANDPLFRGYVPANFKVAQNVNNGRVVIKMTADSPFRVQTFGDLLPASLPNEDLAHQVQKETTDAILNLIEEHVDINRSDNLCFSGGHAHNCLLNYEIANRFSRLHFYPDPVPDDSGTSLGAAKLTWHQETQSTAKMPLLDIYDCGMPP